MWYDRTAGRVRSARPGLIADFHEVDEQARRHDVSNPFRATSVDLVLEAIRN